jgi:hypothetical protein
MVFRNPLESHPRAAVSSPVIYVIAAGRLMHWTVEGSTPNRAGIFHPPIPSNVTFVNRAAFDQLNKSTQETILKVAAAAEARGWRRSQDKTKRYMEQLVANGMKVLPPSRALKTGLQQIGERLTREWLMKVGADGQAVIEAYRKQAMDAGRHDAFIATRLDATRNPPGVGPAGSFTSPDRPDQ